MILQTSDLRRFKQASGHVVANTILPIYNYLHFTGDQLIKHGLGQFVTMDLECEPMLVDERVLMNLVSATTSSEITLTLKNGVVHITDGVKKITSTTEPVSHYPAIPLPEAAGFTMPPELIQHIVRASKFIEADDPINPARCTIYIGGGNLVASNGVILYSAKVAAPEMTLTQPVARLLDGLTLIGYSETPSFQFFNAGEFCYGFNRTETKWIDMSHLLKFDSSTPHFTIGKSELIGFNDYCLAASREKITSSGFSVIGGALVMSMNESVYSFNVEQSARVESGDHDRFNYRTDLLNRMLKAVPDETVTFFRTHPTRYSLVGKDWYGIVMGIAVAVPVMEEETV